MIVLRFPDLPLNGEIQWQREECPYIAGQTLARYLDVNPDLLLVVVSSAVGVIEADDFAAHVPADGDELHVVPKLGGKNRGVIAGILGAIAAVALVIGTSGAATPAAMSLLQAAFAGYGIGSALASATAARPPRIKDGDKTGTQFTWSGIVNADHPGVADPVVWGDTRAGGVRVSAFVRLATFFDNPTSPLDVAMRTIERAYFLIYVSKDRIEAISDVRINGTPIANFPSATYAYTLGEDPEQWYSSTGSPIPRPAGFDAIANTYSASTEITTTPFVYTTQPSFLCDAIELLVAFPLGLFHGTDKGDRDNTTRYKIRYRLNGTGPWTNCTSPGCDATGVRQVKRNDRAPYFEKIRIEHLTPGRYDVELTFVSSDFVSVDKDSWKPFLIGVTEEQQNAPAKPNHALLAVQAVAIESLNGSLDSTVIDCQCKGVWAPWHDGTAWQPKTWVGPDPVAPVGRNPGWLIVNALRNRSTYNLDGSIAYRAWGLGDDIPEENILPSSWKAFADKCATMITVTPDVGAPYSEPMHSLDIVLNQQRPALELLADLLATARASRMMAGNGAQWGVFYDDEEDASQLFTMGNIVSGSLQIDRDFSARTNAFDVTFLDSDNDYEQVTREVVNKHLVEDLGKPVKRDSMSLVGVTGWPNTFREASFALRKIEGVKNVIQFDARTDSILMRVGQVFNFQHERPQWGFGGRVRESSGFNTIFQVLTGTRARKAGADVFIQNTNGETLLDLGAQTWEVRVRFQDGSAEAGELRTVSAADVSDGIAVTSDGWLVLTVAAAFSKVPQYYDLVAFGPLNKSVKPWRCVAITRSAVGFRHITGIEYNATIYPEDGVVEITDYSSLPRYGSLPPPITDLVAFEDLSAQNNNATTSTVKIQWARPLLTPGYGFYKGATIELSYDSVAWQPLGSVEGSTEYRWPNAPQEVPLWFRVTPFSTRGLNRNGAAVTGPLTCHGVPGDYLQSGDDRNVGVIAETFDGASIPTGISFVGFFTPFLGSGKVTLVTNTTGDNRVIWDTGAWIAAYQDQFNVTIKNLAYAMIRMRITPAGTVIQDGSATAVQIVDAFGPGVRFLVKDDGAWHTYRWPLANGVPSLAALLSVTGVEWRFLAGTLPLGTTVEITGFAITQPEENVDLTTAADRFQNAREQFDRFTGTLGFFLRSPVRNVDDIGNLTIHDDNGQVWIDVDGLTHYPVKQARMCVANGVANGQQFSFDTIYSPAGFNSPTLDPAAPKPRAVNKARFICQPAANPNNTALRYAEVTNVTDDNFKVAIVTYTTGVQNAWRANGPWAETAANKSALAKEAAHGATNASSSNAWFDFAGRTLPTTNRSYYRVVGYIKVVMPLLRKDSGGFYWVKVKLGVVFGAPSDGAGGTATPNTIDPPSIFVGSPVIVDPITMLMQTDGQTYRMAVIIGLANGTTVEGSMIKVDWYDTQLETGGAGGDPVSVALDGVEVNYMSGVGVSYTAGAAEQFLILAAEDF